MKRILRLPSPAMVVACIALLIALGGTSYAAIKLPRNSVGAKQLKRNAVTTPKVKNNAITGAKVLESSLGRVPSATNANQLEGVASSGYLKNGAAAGGGLSGTYPNPSLADASVTSAKIAAGAVGVSKFGTIPAVRASVVGTPQTIPNVVVVNVTFDAETFDTANLHSPTTNNHLVTAPVAGVYQITGNVRWAMNATGNRFVDISTTSGGRIASVWELANTNNTDQSVSAAYSLAAGDSVFLEVFQTSGGNLDLVKNATDDPNLSMVWIGPSTAGVPGLPALPAGPTSP